MSSLKTQHAPTARDGDNSYSFQTRNSIPDEVNKPVSFRLARECWCHGGEGTHGNCVDEEHEDEGQVQLGVTSFPGEELYELAWYEAGLETAYKHDQVLDSQQSSADDESIAQDAEVLRGVSWAFSMRFWSHLRGYHPWDSQD